MIPCKEAGNSTQASGPTAANDDMHYAINLANCPPNVIFNRSIAQSSLQVMTCNDLIDLLAQKSGSLAAVKAGLLRSCCLAANPGHLSDHGLRIMLIGAIALKTSQPVGQLVRRGRESSLAGGSAVPFARRDSSSMAR